MTVATPADPAGPSLLRLLELTERALLDGLDEALTGLAASVAQDLGARVVAVHLLDDVAFTLVAAAGSGAEEVPRAIPLGSSLGPATTAIRDTGQVVGLITLDGETRRPDGAELVATAIASARRAVLARDTEAAHVDRLREQASRDDLTGALNRRAFFERLDDELNRSRQRRSDGPLTLVLFDLDHFKAINDAHGHPAGDAALVAFTRVLEGNVRSSDAVGRVGGDEFALLLVGADEQDATRVLDRLLRSLEDGSGTGLGGVQASHGVARCPEDGTTRDRLVAIADERLYEDKGRRGATA